MHLTILIFVGHLEPHSISKLIRRFNLHLRSPYIPISKVQPSIPKFWKWTSISGTIWHLEIKVFHLRYQMSIFWETSISLAKSGTSILFRRNFISKSRTSISLCPDIEDLTILKNAPSISVYNIEAFCFYIEFLVLRYRCFFAWAAVACSSCSVLDTDCMLHNLLCTKRSMWIHDTPVHWGGLHRPLLISPGHLHPPPQGPQDRAQLDRRQERQKHHLTLGCTGLS
jgi:hypothetical protein